MLKIVGCLKVVAWRVEVKIGLRIAYTIKKNRDGTHCALFKFWNRQNVALEKSKLF
jgi:hypothetical protein